MATEKSTDQLLTAFPPVGSDDARLVVLGSMPGVASLAESQYYAHPRNAFWPIMHAIFGGSIDSYKQKRQILVDHRVVVWDVLAHCVRPGSLDANIRGDSVVCNDFSTFLERHPAVTCIAFNGKASARLFSKHALPTLDIEFYTGTRPAPTRRIATSPAATSPVPTSPARTRPVLTNPARTRPARDSAAGPRQIQLLSLPSTSPAMASLRQTEKIVAWREALLQSIDISPIADNQV